MPEEVKKAHFQIILPTKWQHENYKPVCLHLAGTGDHVCSFVISEPYPSNLLFILTLMIII